MIDFWILGCQAIPQRAAVSFLNVWSCIMQHILKMYVQLFLFTDKKGCKTWREKTKGAKKIRYFFLLWNHIYLPSTRKAATSPFLGALCAARAQTKIVITAESTRLSCFTNQMKTPGLAGSWEILKQLALFLLERKTDFPYLMIETWPNVFLILHQLICKPSCHACPKRRWHKERSIKFVFRFEISIGFLIAEILSLRLQNDDVFN